ncbi:hypothetical protein DH2020_033544 [Rehmannia glutinosa]|uniref:diacylglycerol kinase (ATP) n=1 Tax=Rehmannia glutinosa TaxID=99300 RepID=A0ABR0VEX3_REHGL
MVGTRMMAKDMKQSFHNFFSKNQEAAVGNPEVVGILKDYYIPDYILLPESETKEECEVPASCYGKNLRGFERITFSGGLLSLALIFQVFDLGEKTPDKVLHQLYFNLEKHKKNGDNLSAEIQRRLRIIVAGGDGTAGWLLGVVSDLKLSQPPPVATMPLGTGNNLPFSFGWSVKAFLEQVKYAKDMKVDSWHILMRMKAPREGSCDPIAPLDLPHSLHAFHRVSSTDEMNEVNGLVGSFGISPEMTNSIDETSLKVTMGLRNLLLRHYGDYYSTYKLMASVLALTLRRLINIAQLAKVKIMKKPGQWIDLHVPRGIRSIVCLNLPSFSGGLNPWGRPSKQKLHSRDLTPPYVDDGFFEVVGFRDAWHGLVMFAPNGHGTRLAQANRIRFEFHKGAADHTFMRIDGEPWKQPLPVDDDTVVIEISHFGQVSILANAPCKSRSINAPNLPYSPRSSEDDGYNSNEDSFEESSEERMKLGAADTFQIPENFDVARLS